MREEISQTLIYQHLASFPIQALIERKKTHGYNLRREEGSFLNYKDVEVKKSNIGQFEDGLGVFAKKDFKKGEIVIKWHLQILTEDEYNKLPLYEKNNFCHQREGVWYYYPIPERYVNRSHSPNVVPDFENQANVALRDIKKGEELSIPAAFVEDY